MEKEELLRSEIEKIGIQLNSLQLEQFMKYYELLIEWNSVMNLTAITEYDQVVQKHFVDSISMVHVLDKQYLIADNKKVIDIGTGAGFPGIPLKIVFPNLQITLLDSLNKRIKFLNEVIEKLKLKDIEAIHGRAEDYAKQVKYREQYDICVSRAVANLATLSEYCIPYVKEKGYFISYKSETIDEELESSQNAIKKLGGRLDVIEKFVLPGTDIKRAILKIKKEKATEKKYPRKAGMPLKEPLK